MEISACSMHRATISSSIAWTSIIVHYTNCYKLLFTISGFKVQMQFPTNFPYEMAFSLHFIYEKWNLEVLIRLSRYSLTVKWSRLFLIYECDVRCQMWDKHFFMVYYLMLSSRGWIDSISVFIIVECKKKACKRFLRPTTKIFDIIRYVNVINRQKPLKAFSILIEVLDTTNFYLHTLFITRNSKLKLTHLVWRLSSLNVFNPVFAHVKW